MSFIDTHAHLQWKDYGEDLSGIFARAKEAGVEKIIVVGTEISNVEKTIEIAESEDFLYAAVGVHPHDSKDIDEPKDLDFIKEKARHPKVVAIGETGLDYYYEHSDRDTQKKHFANQIGIAKELKKPVIIHSRAAKEDTLEVVTKENAIEVGGVMHCFTEDLEFAKKMLNLGFYISFTGIITFKKKVEALQEVAKYVPLNQMLLETDCPYLTPEPYRGKRNEPSYVKFTAEKIAELKNISVEEVGNQTTENAKKLFKI